MFREQARPGLGAPEWPVVLAARWTDPRLPATLTVLNCSPAAGCPVAVRSPLPGYG